MATYGLFVDAIIFAIAFFFVIKSADYAIVYASRLARDFGISEFAISFLLVGLITALPESVIAFTASAKGFGAVAFVSLIGSDVVDLTFVFGAIAMAIGAISVKAPVLKREGTYLLLLALPLLLSIDGTLTRWDGAVLLIAGLTFLGAIAVDHNIFRARVKREDLFGVIRTIVLLAVSLLVMIVAANFTIAFMSDFAAGIGVPAAFIAVFVIGIGTSLPETVFTIKAMQRGRHDLAFGNILGVVMIDATIMLGIAAVINPIATNLSVVQVSALFAALGACVAIYFIKIHRRIGRWAAAMLLVLYAIFVALQFLTA